MSNPFLEYEIWQQLEGRSLEDLDYTQLYQQIRTRRANTQYRLLVKFVKWLTGIGQKLIP